jgi:hypothetical protein
MMILAIASLFPAEAYAVMNTLQPTTSVVSKPYVAYAFRRESFNPTTTVDISFD